MMMIGRDVGASQGWAGVNLVSRRKSLLLLSRRDVALCPIFLCNGDDDCTDRKQMNKDKRRFITLNISNINMRIIELGITDWTVRTLYVQTTKFHGK